MMKLRIPYRFSAAALAILLGVSLAAADVLVLKSGTAITGKFQGGDPTGITMQVNGQYQRYSLSEVQSLTIVSGAESAAAAPAPAPAAPPPAYSTGRTTTAPPAPVASTSTGSSSSTSTSSSGGLSTRPSTPAPSSSAGSMGVTVPAGTSLVVRMIDTVDSSVHQTGEMFRASLDEPLIVSGRTIAPRGADVTTKLVSVEEAGKISGRSELALVLYDITINGRKYEISTGEVYEAGASRGQQSAKRIGGLAAIGAVIGAIAGGGKGAAQGAAAGAGAGTAVQVLTNGEKVQVPAESRLEFTLAAPLYL
jgi:hypothetical protein